MNATTPSTTSSVPKGPIWFNLGVAVAVVGTGFAAQAEAGNEREIAAGLKDQANTHLTMAGRPYPGSPYEALLAQADTHAGHAKFADTVAIGAWIAAPVLLAIALRFYMVHRGVSDATDGAA